MVDIRAAMPPAIDAAASAEKEISMFRITTLALAAAAAIAATAAAPTAASAADGWRGDRSHQNSRGNDRGWHHGNDNGWRHNWRGRDRSGFVVRFAAPAYAYAPRCYVSRRWVDTRWGWRLRTVRVCS
jgi:hypothetical protein